MYLEKMIEIIQVKMANKKFLLMFKGGVCVR